MNLEAIMRRGRIFFYLAFIIILGLVAAVVVWQRFLQPPAQIGTETTPQAPAVEMVNVVMITQRVPRGGVIDESVVGVVPWQKDAVIQGMFTNVNDVIGRLAKFDLDAGIPLTSSMLVDTAEQLSATGSVAALSIPRGMVAVSIPINRLSSVSYAPQAGDHVNVIVTMQFVDLDTDFQTKLPDNTSAVIAPGPGVLIGSGTGENASAQVQLELSKVTSQNVTGGIGSTVGRAEVDPVLGQTFYVVPSEEQRPRLVSQSLLQDAVVLHMGTFPLEETPTTTQQTNLPVTDQTQQEQPAETQQTAATQQQNQGPDVVTLIVSPQDAVTLNYLIFTNAQLTLALRSAQDESRFETEAVTLQFLLDQYNIPVPVKLPYGQEPRVDRLAFPELKNDTLPTPAP
jgi:Flp pilus assembly protein CpaB